MKSMKKREGHVFSWHMIPMRAEEGVKTMTMVRRETAADGTLDGHW